MAQFALIRAGVGIGVCQVPLGERDPALQRVLPKAVSVPLACWVTMHEDLRGSPRCRATFEALVTGLQAYVGGQGRRGGRLSRDPSRTGPPAR